MSVQHPDILFVTVDCLRPDYTDCYGHTTNATPNIAEFASDDGVAVLEGYVNSPGTRWAIQTLHTGVYTTRIEGNGDPGGIPTLPSVLAEQGYSTAAFAYNGNFSRQYNYEKYYDNFVGVKEYADEEDSLKSIGTEIAEKIPRRGKHIFPTYITVSIYR